MPISANARSYSGKPSLVTDGDTPLEQREYRDLAPEEETTL